MSSEINNIINNMINTESQIDIIGNLYICDELCNLTFNYKDNEDINNLHITHDKNSIIMEIKYNGKSTINYNGGEKFGTKDIKFNLIKILLISPAKHFIKSFRNRMELILIHQSDDGKTFQNISILLDISDDVEYQKKLQYQLFMDIAENIPTKTVNSKKIDTKYTWSAEDLLPDNRSFYTYNSPTDSNVNWIIFSNTVFAPSLLLDNYLKYVLNPVKSVKGDVGDKVEKFINAPIPINPKNLILFSHQIIEGIPATCAKKLFNEVKSKTSTQPPQNKNISESSEKDNTTNDKTNDKSNDKTNDKSNDKTDDKTNETTDDTQSEEEKSTPWYKSFWFWFISIIIFLALILPTILFFIFKDRIMTDFMTQNNGAMDNYFDLFLHYYTLLQKYLYQYYQSSKLITDQSTLEMGNISGQSPSGQSQIGQPQIGQNTSGQTPSGQTLSEQYTVGQNTTGQPLSGQYTAGQYTSGQPTIRQNTTGQYTTGQPTLGQPTSGQNITRQNIMGQPILGQPILGQPILGETTNNRSKRVNNSNKRQKAAALLASV
jgi:carbonic anhydrase